MAVGRLELSHEFTEGVFAVIPDNDSMFVESVGE